MKKAYNVTFRWSAESNTYCSNIVIAEDIEDIKVHYVKHEIIAISEANNSDIDEANRKGKPIIEVEHTTFVKRVFDFIIENGWDNDLKHIEFNDASCFGTCYTKERTSTQDFYIYAEEGRLVLV